MATVVEAPLDKEVTGRPLGNELARFIGPTILAVVFATFSRVIQKTHRIRMHYWIAPDVRKCVGSALDSDRIALDVSTEGRVVIPEVVVVCLSNRSSRGEHFFSQALNPTWISGSSHR
jgi:hypothetical protein